MTLRDQISHSPYPREALARMSHVTRSGRRTHGWRCATPRATVSCSRAPGGGCCSGVATSRRSRPSSTSSGATSTSRPAGAGAGHRSTSPRGPAAGAWLDARHRRPRRGRRGRRGAPRRPLGAHHRRPRPRAPRCAWSREWWLPARSQVTGAVPVPATSPPRTGTVINGIPPEILGAEHARPGRRAAGRARAARGAVPTPQARHSTAGTPTTTTTPGGGPRPTAAGRSRAPVTSSSRRPTPCSRCAARAAT